MTFFAKKLINCATNKLKNQEDFLMIIQDLKDPKSFFDYKKNPKELTIEEARLEFKKVILTARVRKYIKL